MKEINKRCEHCKARIVQGKTPRHNCKACWTKFFKESRGRALAIQKGIELVGREKTINVIGSRMMKYFERYNTANA